MHKKRVLKGTAQASLVLALAGAVLGLLTSPAGAQANYGNDVNDCHGIWWNTDWNQQCPSGADDSGFYRSTADCTAPQIPDQTEKHYRPVGNSSSYDGDDCTYGIHYVGTVFWD